MIDRPSCTPTHRDADTPVTATSSHLGHTTIVTDNRLISEST